MSTFSEVALGAQKFLAAASAAVAVIVADGLVDGTAEKWTTGIVAALGAALVYFVPNKDTNGNNVSKSEEELNREVQQATQREKDRVTANSQPVSPDVPGTDSVAVPGELPVSDAPAL